MVVGFCGSIEVRYVPPEAGGPCSLEELAQLRNSIRRAVDSAFGEIFSLNYSVSESIGLPHTFYSNQDSSL